VKDRPTLVYIYGPPAVGKLTVATELQRRTDLRLFHNHLTVNAVRSVFDFGTEGFSEVVHRVRLDVFETAARHGIDVIFTNNSVWAVPDGRALFATFAQEARRRVESSGGRVVFVQLRAPESALRERVGAASRKAHGKLLDPERLAEMLDGVDLTPLSHDDLVIDTSEMSPEEAAAGIATALE
jgi:broad-specificity NMP kinase